jgi:hypothetical protein
MRPAFFGIGGKSASARAEISLQAHAGEEIHVQLAVGNDWANTLKVVNPAERSTERLGATFRKVDTKNDDIDQTDLAAESSNVSYRVLDGDRYEVDLGRPETRVIDNSGGTSSVVRTFRLSREWTRTLTTDTEKALKATAGLTIPWVKIKAEIEGALNQHFSHSFQERQSFEDTVVVTVAAHTKTTVLFSWKEIRQAGMVLMSRDGRQLLNVPFESVVGLSFDQKQIDQ